MTNDPHQYIKDILTAYQIAAESKGWDGDEIACTKALEILQKCNLVPQGHVRIPTTNEEARMMVNLGYIHLRDHAPDMLKDNSVFSGVRQGPFHKTIEVLHPFYTEFEKYRREPGEPDSSVLHRIIFNERWFRRLYYVTLAGLIAMIILFVLAGHALGLI